MNSKYIIIIFLVLFIVWGVWIFRHRTQPTTNNPTPSSVSVDAAGRYIPDQVNKASGCVEADSLPDHACSPGAVNPSVTQNNLQTTICMSGYSKTIRPPVSYTDNLKKLQMQDYGLTGTTKNYEEDHLISLELGGDPTSRANLWPEAYSPTPGAYEKDHVENYLHKQVCAGRIALAEAQKEIATNWLEVYKSVSNISGY